MPHRKVMVLYHGNCYDGTGARYAAWKKFANNAHYKPVLYGKPIPKIPEGVEEIYILDFSYSKKELLELREHYKVVVLDHHKTAQEDLKDLDFAIFDMNKSGAVLAWEYFFPGEKVPRLLEFVQDRDLWNWKYESTEAVTYAIPLLKSNMGNWDKYKDDTDKLIEKGNAIKEYNQIKIDSVLEDQIKVIEFFGYKRVGIVNSTTLVSEIGNAICQQGYDLAIIYSVTPENEILLSFRSGKNSSVDVSTIAKKFGGGGHKSASGCKVSFDVLISILNNMFSDAEVTV